MAQSASSTNHLPGPSRIYTAIWALLALLAALYIATLIYKPEILGGVIKHPVSDQESNKGVRSLSKAVARLKALKRDVKMLEAEIERLKFMDSAGTTRAGSFKPPASVEIQKNQPAPASIKPHDKARLEKKTSGRRLVQIPAQSVNSPSVKPPVVTASTQKAKASPTAKELAARFSDAADRNGNMREAKKTETKKTVETDQPEPRVKSAALKGVKIISQTEQTAQPAPKKPAQLIGEAAQKSKDNILAAKRIKTLPIKVAGAKTNQNTEQGNISVPKLDTFGKKAKIQTGSLRPQPPAIKFGAPVVTRRKVALRLVAGPSKDALRLNWLALKDRYGSILQGLSPRYEVLGSKTNRRYRLIAGPVNSAARAVSLCDHLNANNITCTVSALTGKRL